jgi:hypothetical protein
MVGMAATYDFTEEQKSARCCFNEAYEVHVGFQAFRRLSLHRHVRCRILQPPRNDQLSHLNVSEIKNDITRLFDCGINDSRDEESLSKDATPPFVCALTIDTLNQAVVNSSTCQDVLARIVVQRANNPDDWENPCVDPAQMTITSSFGQEPICRFLLKTLTKVT